MTDSHPDADAIAAAAEVVGKTLREDDLAIVPRSEVNARVKDRLEADTITHEAVRRGLEEAGWRYTRHLYYHEAAFEERARAVAASLVEATHIAITEEEILDRVAAPTERGDETGWERGAAVSLLRETFEGEGWIVHRADADPGGERVFYFRSLADVIRDLHPNGRYPFDPGDIAQLYREVAVGDRETD